MTTRRGARLLQRRVNFYSCGAYKFKRAGVKLVGKLGNLKNNIKDLSTTNISFDGEVSEGFNEPNLVVNFRKFFMYFSSSAGSSKLGTRLKKIMTFERNNVSLKRVRSTSHRKSTLLKGFNFLGLKKHNNDSFSTGMSPGMELCGSDKTVRLHSNFFVKKFSAVFSLFNFNSSANEVFSFFSSLFTPVFTSSNTKAGSLVATRNAASEFTSVEMSLREAQAKRSSSDGLFMNKHLHKLIFGVSESMFSENVERSASAPSDVLGLSCKGLSRVALMFKKLLCSAVASLRIFSFNTVYRKKKQFLVSKFFSLFASNEFSIVFKNFSYIILLNVILVAVRKFSMGVLRSIRD